jgi:hypothetical protein
MTIYDPQVAVSIYNLPANMPLVAIDEAIQSIRRTEELRDRGLRLPLTRQEVGHAFPADVDEVVYISPDAYLRSIVAVVWNAFRHPFSTTYIDLSTGDCVTPMAIVDESEVVGVQ